MKQLRLVLAIVLALFTALLVGCGSSQGSAKPAVTTPAPAPSASVPEPTTPTPTPTYESPTTTAPTPAPSETTELNAKFGTQYTVTVEDYNGVTTADLAVAAPVVDAALNGGYSRPVNNGQWLSFKVTFKGTKGTFDYNAFDFYVRAPDGAHISPDYNKEPLLSAGTLRAGEPVSGYVSFDAPRHGTLVYQPSSVSGGSLAEWKF